MPRDRSQCSRKKEREESMKMQGRRKENRGRKEGKDREKEMVKIHSLRSQEAELMSYDASASLSRHLIFKALKIHILFSWVQ